MYIHNALYTKIEYTYSIYDKKLNEILKMYKFYN